ncbi:MAG TPA: enoyl-CoA hydratase-related protein [Sphingobacteriaceae bacterium]|nr:enoyl-CoA hydratase-related protein [Sphingobacteriaceae bacterium]
MAAYSSFEHLLVEFPEDNIALVRLNRPQVLNALSVALLRELEAVLGQLDADDAVGCIVLTGSERAFAAGADLKEMAGFTPMDLQLGELLRPWDRVGLVEKPIIAAVSGYALGGGFELALACDTIVAAESARFGLPEVQLGIMPGAGGTQRLLRTIGKARAMEIILTGRHITAAEAEAMGLVCRVVPEEECVAAALALARDIAQNAPLAVRLAKRAILHAEDAPLSAGIEYERQLFHLLFASEDQKEGFDAFLNKRKPQWRGR